MLRDSNVLAGLGLGIVATIVGNFAFLNNPKVAAKMRLTACWEKHEGGRNLYGVANGNAEILNEEIVTATKKNVGGIRAPVV
eukprot:scaffold181684_cov21-Tisochrysis_lutea.AAC.1